MKKPYVIFFIITLICCVWFLFAGSKKQPNQIPDTPEASIAPPPSTTFSKTPSPSVPMVDSNPIKKAEKKPAPNVLERIKLMQERRPSFGFDAQQVSEALSRDKVFTIVPKASPTLPLSKEQREDGRKFIKFDVLKLETLMVNDLLKLTVNDKQIEYNFIVDSIQTNEGGSVSWMGHIESNDGSTYSANFTRGENLTVASFNTPEGNYTLQAHGDDGWVASSSLLFKHDPSINDAVEPLSQTGDRVINAPIP